MNDLFRNIRFYVLLTTATLIVASYLWAGITITQNAEQIIFITQTYALLAFAYLYIALLTTPLTKTFPKLPFRGKYIKARRAIGVSAFFFGLLHSYFAFFGELGGFSGLQILPGKYLVAIALSFTALCILSLMALTSFDVMIAKLTYPKWKFIHRFIYLAAIFIFIHALLIGSHFADWSEMLPRLVFVAVAFLFVLEIRRLYKYIQSKFLKTSPLSGR